MSIESLQTAAWIVIPLAICGSVVLACCLQRGAVSESAVAIAEQDHLLDLDQAYGHWDSVEELLDATWPARRRLMQIEIALCRKAGIQRGDGSDMNDRIVAAVYDGRGWSELMSDMNRLESAK